MIRWFESSGYISCRNGVGKPPSDLEQLIAGGQGPVGRTRGFLFQSLQRAAGHPYRVLPSLS